MAANQQQSSSKPSGNQQQPLPRRKELAQGEGEGVDAANAEMDTTRGAQGTERG